MTISLEALIPLLCAVIAVIALGAAMFDRQSRVLVIKLVGLSAVAVGAAWSIHALNFDEVVLKTMSFGQALLRLWSFLVDCDPGYFAEHSKDQGRRQGLTQGAVVGLARGGFGVDSENTAPESLPDPGLAPPLIFDRPGFRVLCRHVGDRAPGGLAVRATKIQVLSQGTWLGGVRGACGVDSAGTWFGVTTRLLLEVAAIAKEGKSRCRFRLLRYCS